MYTPPLNQEGTFTFGSPYDNIVSSNQIFKVIAVRTLLDLESSEEQPYKTIYEPVGLTLENFHSDLSGNVPIVVLGDDSGGMLYIPANRLLSDGKASEYKYKQFGMLVDLGNLPIGTNTDLVVSAVQEAIYSTLGVATTPVVSPTSTTFTVGKVEHDDFVLALANKKTVVTSWKSKYLELNAKFNKQKDLLTNLENVYNDTGIIGG